MNLGFLTTGWKPGPTVSKKERARRRAEWKRRVGARVKEMRAEYRRLGKSARASYPGKRKLEQLFHEVYGPGGMLENPNRRIPEATPAQVRAFERLIKGKSMAQKKKRKTRKKKMPAGLRKYWAAKKRRLHARRKRVKKNTRRRRTVRRRRPSLRVKNFRRRVKRVKKTLRRRRRPNPRPRRPRSVRPPFPMTYGQLKKYARQLARATGKRVIIKKP